ncbi:MAG: DegT/DnrJ/EryC1/StrS family aminotransferase [Candidatus Omnitrophica bacterium]|nr:DegT/DnrJ/EryC1/StrS family aminotransferase [Candidatus Omnitrophota bacterium]
MSEVSQAVTRVAEASEFVLGEEVETFEQEFAAYCGSGHCVGVSSGTDALSLALRALGIGLGDEVVVPAASFVATAEAVCHVGATPVFVDIDPGSFLIDLAGVRQALRQRSRVRAVIPVHLYGRMTPMRELLDLTNEFGVRVVEDAAQAHGAVLGGLKAGTFADIGCFSFYPTKNLGAWGDAGAVVTHDPGLAARVRTLRNHGQEGYQVHQELGFSHRMDAMQAAVLRAKLRRLEDWNARRILWAQRYRTVLDDCGMGYQCPGPKGSHVYHMMAIRVPDRKGLRQKMLNYGVETGMHYPVPLHRQPSLQRLGIAAKSLPVSEKVCAEVVTLPLYPLMEDPEFLRIEEALRSLHVQG